MSEMSYWSQFTQHACYPKDCNCEAIRDAWIRQPSATYSSLPIIILGLWMIKQSLKLDMKLVVQGLSVVFLGIASTLAHGTFTALALHMDFLAIILCFSWLAIYCSGMRWGWTWIFLWLGLTALGFTMTYIFVSYRILFCTLYFVLVFMIWLVWYKKNKTVKKYFMISYGILSVSAILFFLDETRIWCTDPEGWFLGHSLWHIGVCFSIWYSFMGFKKLYPPKENLI